METITDIREGLRDLQNDLDRATARGLTMAQDDSTTLEDMQAQSDAVDKIQARMALMQQRLDSLEGKKPAPGSNPVGETPKNGGFATAGEFFASVARAASPRRTVDDRLRGVQDAATGGNEGTDAEGGYLVPPEYVAGIIDQVQSQSLLYPQARKVQIAGNRLIETYLNQSSRKDGPTGSRHGGILAYWKSEAAQLTATKAAFGQRTTEAHKLTAYCPVTEELLQDAPAIESTLNGLVAKEFAFKVDDAILTGGGGDAPLGLLTTGSGSNPSNGALVTIAKETGQAAATLNTANILKMYNALIAQQRANAKWYINQDLELVLMQLMMETGSIKSTGDSAVERIVGSFGMPLYAPPGAYGNENARLIGLPVQCCEHCAALGSLGDILLADMTQYLIVERSNMIKQTSMHVRFDYDETVFKFVWRVGGRPDWMSSIEAYKGSTKRSPYVALAARS